MSNLLSWNMDDKETLLQLLDQIEHLRNLENNIFHLFGVSDDSPLDSSINNLYDVFLHFATKHVDISDFDIDEITDIVFGDGKFNVKEKFDAIFYIIQKGGDVT